MSRLLGLKLCRMDFVLSAAAGPRVRPGPVCLSYRPGTDRAISFMVCLARKRASARFRLLCLSISRFQRVRTGFLSALDVPPKPLLRVWTAVSRRGSFGK